MADVIIRIENISKHFGTLKAVDAVSLEVKQGEIYALIGPNGAGKTTLVKILVGLLSPDSGHAIIAGYDITVDSLRARKAFGYLPDNPSAYDFLTGNEFLKMTGALNNLPQKETLAKIKELSDLFPIKDVLNQTMGNYSRGNRQKTAFLASLIAKHQALIIDEPVAGLDPSSITAFGNYLTEFVKQGNAVFMVTHTLSFAQKFADRVGVLHQGRLVAQENVSGHDLEQLYQDLTNPK